MRKLWTINLPRAAGRRGALPELFFAPLDNISRAAVVPGLLEVARARVPAAARRQAIRVRVFRFRMFFVVAPLGLVVQDLDESVQEGLPVPKLSHEAVRVEHGD